ncbi:uncharacterized protein LOC117792640 [Drosophila innubila]|uniref:uncharacterized protein LOC117792640 n=1 Tax=Drosophila innubila TaxID=198719 RepID=UPI00148C4387|nr:uncharacterized protein LOC117792640 [Drosophila innubila]
MLTVFIIALVVSATSATPNYGDAVEMLLGEFKRIMPCGRLDIPPLEPISTDMVDLDFNNGDTNITGSIRHFRLSGLSSFQILQNSYNESAMHHVIDIIFSKIQAFGFLDLEGTLDIAGFSLPFEYSVQINVKLTDLRFMIEYTFGQSLISPKGLRISSFDFKFFVGEVKAENWHKSLDIALNNYLNDLVGSLSSLVIKEMQPYVKDMSDAFGMLTNMSNEMLSEMSITELTEFYQQIAESMRSENCTIKA